MEILKVNGQVLELLPHLQFDLQAYLIACSNSIYAINYIGENFKNDSNFFLKLIKYLNESKRNYCCQFIGETLKQSREFFLQILPYCGIAFQYAHLSLQSDCELSRVAVVNTINAYNVLTEENKSNTEIFELAFNKNYKIYENSPNAVKETFLYALTYIKQGGNIRQIPKIFHDNKEVILAVVSLNGYELERFDVKHKEKLSNCSKRNSK